MHPRKTNARFIERHYDNENLIISSEPMKPPIYRMCEDGAFRCQEQIASMQKPQEEPLITEGLRQAITEHFSKITIQSQQEQSDDGMTTELASMNIPIINFSRGGVKRINLQE